MTPPRGHRDDLAASTYDRYYPDSTGARGQHTALPIRTSAPQSTQSPAAASYDTRPHTSRAAYDGAGYSSQEDRDRRRSHRSPQDSPAQPGSNRSQRTRQVPAQSRSQTAVGQTPVNTELPRENSTVINRIVVDDPSADVARENARIAEARPHPMGTDVTPVGSLGLVGESGVGKTATAEGLAKRIVDGDVPESLADSVVFSLDMGALLAGTKYRGDFEKRFKSLLSDLKKQKNSILFIDEIHTIIGAGAASGGVMDASNLLKPLLSSGEIRCMGSTTYQEFRGIFDKDRALSRRFQKVDVVEPTVEQTVDQDILEVLTLAVVAVVAVQALAQTAVVQQVVQASLSYVTHWRNL